MGNSQEGDKHNEGQDLEEQQTDGITEQLKIPYDPPE